MLPLHVSFCLQNENMEKIGNPHKNQGVPKRKMFTNTCLIINTLSFIVILTFTPLSRQLYIPTNLHSARNSPPKFPLYFVDNHEKRNKIPVHHCTSGFDSHSVLRVVIAFFLHHHLSYISHVYFLISLSIYFCLKIMQHTEK